MKSAKRLLLISNSTTYGQGYLDHAEKDIKDIVGPGARIVFVPFALHDWGAYARKAQQRLEAMGLSVASIHDLSNVARTTEQADAIFVGGGNTFRLLKGLHEWNLLTAIRRRVEEGGVYVGSSAGSIVACPTLKTTKDMPVVQPPSFEALGLVPFQISPHYLDPDPRSTHMGETQEERIMQFLEENDAPVVGLREGSMLRVEQGRIILKGPGAARVFQRSKAAEEWQSGSELSAVLLESVSSAGAAR